MESLIPNIGKIIRQLRKEKKLSQTDIRKITGIEASYVSRIETGKIKSPSVKTMLKIAEALETTVENIIQKAIRELCLSSNLGNPSSDVCQNCGKKLNRQK